MRQTAALFTALFLCCCAEPVRPQPTVVEGVPACQAPLRKALGDVEELRQQGWLERALLQTTEAEALCAPLAYEAEAVKLDLLIELGEDEEAARVSASMSTRGGMPADLMAKVGEIGSRPARAKTRADLKRADELRARGDVEGATAAYRQAVTEHPRDPVSLAALGEIELEGSNRAESRRLFARAVRAAGGKARVVAFEPEREQGPVTTGMLRPDGVTAGVLRRIAAPGQSYRWALVGPEVRMGSEEVLIFGANQPLVVASLDGRAVRTLALRDVTEATFVPGDRAIVALAQGAVHRLDGGNGAVLAKQSVAGQSLRFAGSARLAVDTQVLRFPELTPAYTINEGEKLSPRLTIHAEDRETKKGTHTVIVVRSVEDGSVVFERDLGEQVYDPTMEVHPSGRYVGWLGEAAPGEETQGGIWDVETKKITKIPYKGMYRVNPAALRITGDGQGACVYDLGWTATPVVRGKVALCWSRGGEAVLTRIEPTPKFRPVWGADAHGGLSPDGKLAAFAESAPITDHSVKIAVRVIDVSTGQNVNRFEVGELEFAAVDAFFVTSGVVRVVANAAFAGEYDARTGARVANPPDAEEPDLDVLRENRGRWVGRARTRVLVRADALETSNDQGTRCWTMDLRSAPVERCAMSKGDHVPVKAGKASLPGRASSMQLAVPIKTGYGFVMQVGKREMFVALDEWMARYFSLTGELLMTVVGLSPERLVAMLPDGTFALVGEGDKGLDLLACTAGEVVMPFAACSEKRVDAEALLQSMTNEDDANKPDARPSAD